MRVLFLNPIGHVGGAERSLLNLLAGLRRIAPQTRLTLVAGGSGPLIDEARALGAAVRVVSMPPRLSQLGDWAAGRATAERLMLAARALGCGADATAYIHSLRRLVAAEAPDLIHTNGFKMHVMGLWAAPRSTPVLWHVHDYLSGRPLMAPLMRVHARWSKAAVANSASVAADLRSVCGPALPIRTLFNAIDLEAFAPYGAQTDLDRAAGLNPPPPGTLKVGLIAAFARWKGQEIFLHALAALPPRLAVRGYVIGGPLYQTAGSQYSLDELRRLAGELGLSEKIAFTGYLQDAAAAIRSLDLVVHASTLPEPFGLTIAEAMACGKPIIASAAGGAGEIVDSGHAIPVVPGDTLAIARAISELTDAQLRGRLGRTGRLFAERRFGSPEIAGTMLNIYEEVMRGGLRPAA